MLFEFVGDRTRKPGFRATLLPRASNSVDFCPPIVARSDRMKLFRQPGFLVASRLLAVLLAALSSAAGTSQEAPAPELGKWGTVAPQSADVRLPDTLVHDDTRGGNYQALQALCGSHGGGFAAVWRDLRDGMIGLYLVRLSATGQALEPERPIHQPHSGRRRDPAVALAGDSTGAVVWTSVSGGQNTPFLRPFDAAGEFTSPDIPLLAKEDAGPPRGRAREGGGRQPAVVVLPKGGLAVAWTQGGQDAKVMLQEFESTGEPRGAPVSLNPVDQPASEPGVGLAVERSGSLMCVWKSAAGNVALARGRAGAKPVNCGAGACVRVCTDGAGGFWALFSLDGAAVLRHLDADGRVDREEVRPFAGATSALDMAVGDAGLALLVQPADSMPSDPRPGDEPKPPKIERPKNERSGAPGGGGVSPATAADVLEVILLDPDGRSKDVAPLSVITADSTGISTPHIASNGSTLFIAWTDTRNGDSDVFGRTLTWTAGTPLQLGAERRLNTDFGSADQGHARVAGAGPRGVIAWQDGRDGGERLFARLFGIPGALTSPEIEVPALVEGGPAPVQAYRVLPEVAMRGNGDFVVVWKQLSDAGPTLQAQAFDVAGRPIAAALAVDEGQKCSGDPPAAAAALPAERGYLLVWTRAGAGVWARRLDPSGALASVPRRVDPEAKDDCDNPSVAVLDDARLIVAWNVRPQPGGQWRLRARFLELDGAPRGDELSFEPSRFGHDWDPSVAPAAHNGFVMAWCAGTPSDPGRDVVARVYDARAKPEGPILTISYMSNEQDFPSVARLSDKSYVVAWEDDISGLDHTYLRRILPNARDMGPRVRLNELGTRAVEDRVLPTLCALGDGLAGSWGDRRRSLGWDVFLRILGPRFDEVPKK